MTSHQILQKTLKTVVRHTRPGIRTLTLCHLAEAVLRKHNAVSYLKGYKPEWATSRFPASLSVSINNEIAYGFPTQYCLKDGDIVTYHVAIKANGSFSTGTITVPVGKIDKLAKKLIKSAKQALYEGLEVLKDGVKVRDIAEAIENSAKKSGYVVNRTFTGHVIGEKLYEEPYIYHAKNWLYHNPKAYDAYDHYLGLELKAGMIVVLQPTLTKRDAFGTLSTNKWTWITRDKLRASTFSKMVEITDNGYIDIRD